MNNKRMKIDIDEQSGFCFGVVGAITTAERELACADTLYCLGDIVHNGQEVERLSAIGLRTITKEEFVDMGDVRVLLRAHGEPPSTYETAAKNGVKIVDATCPVVLKLQKKINRAHKENPNAQIVIYGKQGHAEVLGLVGQTNGEAVVIEDEKGLVKIDYGKDIILFSQTTKSLDGFARIVQCIQEQIADDVEFQYFDTICRQVANRMPAIKEFAKKYDVVIFVSGAKSSNGKVLFGECRSVNDNTYMVSAAEELQAEWFEGASTVGICGATSTPKWLMEEVAKEIEKFQ